MKIRILSIFFMIACCISTSEAIEIKGVSYTAWSQYELFSEDSDASLIEARATGCNWIAICTWWFQNDANSTVIEPNYAGYSADPNSVAHAISTCHELGMKVMLKPIVDCVDGSWRGDINPSTAWFAAYRDFLNFWADLAQDNDVEMFCVGCELANTVSWSASWQTLIQEVGNHYTGPLTYAAKDGIGTIRQRRHAIRI